MRSSTSVSNTNALGPNAWPARNRGRHRFAPTGPPPRRTCWRPRAGLRCERDKWCRSLEIVRQLDNAGARAVQEGGVARVVSPERAPHRKILIADLEPLSLCDRDGRT